MALTIFFKVIVVLALLNALALVSGVSASTCSLTGLKVSGNSLINGNGQKVRLVGVNRSGMEFSCVQDGAFSDGPVDATSIAAMKTWNINTVRVPVNEDCFLAINGASPEGSAYQNDLVTYFNLLTQNGFAIILDLHWTASGSTEATAQTPMPDSSHAVTFWTQAATLFGNYTNVIFDLFNEPYPCFSGSGMSCSTTNCDGSSTTQAWECLLNGGSSCPGLSYTAAGFQSLVTAIRGTGATNVIMSNGIHYSGCLDQWSTYKPTDPLNNIIPGAHIYAGHTCSDSGCWGSYIQPLTSKYPVLFGEFGEYDCATTFINQLMTWADPLNINYVAWTWNTWDCASGPALISDYTGTATAYGAGFQSHIASLPAYCSAPSSSTATSSSTSTHATTASTSTSTSTSTHATTASTATSTSTSTHSTSTSTSASSTGTSGCHATVSATLSSSWNGGGQVAITVTNSGTSPIKSVSLAISGSPSVFNLVVITAGNYNLASYAFPLAVSSSFTGGGFTYSGSEPSVTLSSVGC